MKRNSSNRKYNSGFTLVELIVVIAILAILAGVGALGYGAYIEYAKKGQDKATVGEIMHAIELANYDNPALFENGGIVYVSGPDGSGTTSSSSAISTALSNALGDLATVKLTSDSWVLENMDGLSNLGEKGSRIEAYYNKINDSGKTATFADDVDSLWNTVVNAKEDFGGSRDDYLKLAINYAKTNGTGTGTGTGNAFDEWKNGKMITKMGAQDGQAVSLARNYCFATYAAKQNLSPAMEAQLQKYIDEGYGQYGTSGLHTQGFWNYFEEDASGNNTKSSWEEIVGKYEEDQAEIDVAAYLALMEAADAVGTDDMNDDAYMDAMEKHLGTVVGAMSSKEALENAKNITGDFATIRVRKNADGTVECTPYPTELKPSESVGGSGSGGAEEGTCGLKHTTTIIINTNNSEISNPRINVQDTAGGKVTGKISDKASAAEIILCTKGGTKTVTVTNNAGATLKSSADSVFTVSGNTLTAVATGSANLTIEISGKTYSIKVTVH